MNSEEITIKFTIKEWKAKLFKLLLLLLLVPFLLWVWPYYQLYLVRMEGEAAIIRATYEAKQRNLIPNQSFVPAQPPSPLLDQ